MFEVVGKLRCPVCSDVIQPDDKVFLDLINTIIHQKCYYKFSAYQLPIVDKGSFKKMIFKYPFFNEHIKNDSIWKAFLIREWLLIFVSSKVCGFLFLYFIQRVSRTKFVSNITIFYFKRYQWIVGATRVFIIDEAGYFPFDKLTANIFFSPITKRLEKDA